MKAISFKLSGKTACFRKPDVNAYAYFTYNNIHKPALLGMLGAILGLGGYTQLHDKNSGFKKGQLGYDAGFPEFYDKLQHLKVSITPLAPNGYFSKKIQTFNNSVGYASQEQGGNLVVREQWLENPAWQIMILDDGSEEFVKLSEYLLGGKSVFIPYLGKNDHPAAIDEVEIVTLLEPQGSYIDSLFIKDGTSLGWAKEDESPFLFQEVSPMRLQKEYHFYEYETLVLTNCEVENGSNTLFGYNHKNYNFF
jgi:CRISPR-associated protein Cas5h